MATPTKAVILAAGLGSRLAPLTLDRPKPLVPYHGEPMVGRILRQLRSWGVEDVILNLHHRADRMLEALPALRPDGMRLSLSYEPVLLGTGGPLRRMAWFLGDEPFWMVNADLAFDLDPAPLLRARARSKALACLWMVPDQGPRTVRLANGRVADFRAGAKGTHTFSGLHLLSPRILDWLPTEETPGSIIHAYESAIRAGETILGLEVHGSHWADLGTPEQVIEAHGGASVVWPGARVAASTRLHRAIVGDGARLRAGREAGGVVVSPSVGLSEAERQRLPGAEAVEFLDARGSDRDFRRVHRRTDSLILMRRGDARPENARFVGHTRFLARQGLRVPGILWENGHSTCLEDLGRVDLLRRVREGSPRRNRRDMRIALSMVARLHARGVARAAARLEMEAPFRPTLYAWEHDLFLHEFLARHDPDTEAATLFPALGELTRRLCDNPPVLLHRDLQSTNILWHRGAPALIDYQGMRLGPAAYDLGSLLADPYVAWPLAEQLRFLGAYNRVADVAVDEAPYRAGALQRLCQALGAYGRLGAKEETRRFLAHIPAAVRQIRALSGTDPAWESLHRWATRFLQRQPPGNRVESPKPFRKRPH